jgi:hypothetical protein
MRPPRPDPRSRTRGARASDLGRAIRLAAATVGILLLLVRPVAGAGLLPDVSLPVALPSLPLPTLPPLPVPTPTLKLPTLPPLPLPTPTPKLPTIPPLPSLPLPTPTLPPPPSLPLPTPTLPPPPSLPVPTPTLPALSPSPSASTAEPLPAGSTTPSVVPGAGPISASASPIAAQPSSPVDVSAPEAGGLGALFDALAFPALVGVPIVILFAILVTQLAVGAAWMPVIRRWLNRRV